MEEFRISSKNKETILALGAESAGNFSIYKNDTIYFSEDFGDLLIDANFKKYQQALNGFLNKNKIKPTIILSDLHPLFKTTELAKNLAKKYKAKHVPVQHHLAHIFSALGDESLQAKSYKLKADFIGIACDGTGFSEDGTVWGGEIFKIQPTKHNMRHTRIGHLEHQMLIGGEKAIEEPARVLISILSKIHHSQDVIPDLIRNPEQNAIPDSRFHENDKFNKFLAYKHVKNHYSKNEFELLWNQLEQNFNCIETSSTARILDAVSLLLGFTKNKRTYKHEPVDNLEKNSTVSYKLNPVIEFNEKEKMFILKTTPLFEYLIKNLSKDKNRLAATAQQYFADGLIEISNRQSVPKIFFAGGMANNKIISSTLESKGVYTNKKIPRGDAGISFGQIFYYLLAN